MASQNNLQRLTTDSSLFPTGAAEQCPASIRSHLGTIAQQMRVLKVPYSDAVNSFQECFIIEVLISHSCHMGKASQELGMHPNTLTRVLRQLHIDVREIRRRQMAGARSTRESVTEIRPPIAINLRENLHSVDR